MNDRIMVVFFKTTGFGVHIMVKEFSVFGVWNILGKLFEMNMRNRK